MSDTTFASGTVVASSWLNDVNAATYRAQSALSGSTNRTALSKFADSISVKDFGAVGNGVADDTAAIQAAIDYGFTNSKAVFVPSGTYICSNITTYPASTIIGQGRQLTIFKAKAGTAGIWWDATTQGASKLVLWGLAWYGNNEAGITFGIKAGKFGGAGTQYGTEGVISDLWIRDLPNAVGFSVDANVGIMTNLTIQSCLSGFICIGSSNWGRNIISVAPKNTGTGIQVSSGHWSGLFVEAPETGCTPIYLLRPCDVYGVTVSLSNAAVTNFTQLILIDALCGTQWNVTGLTINPALGTYTNVFKQGALGFDGTKGSTFGEYATQSSKIGTSSDARAVTQRLSKAVSLDFPNIVAGGQQDLTTALSGAVAGQPVVIGFTSTGPFAGLRYEAWVSAADTITVRAYNGTGAGIDPPAQTFSLLTWAF